MRLIFAYLTFVLSNFCLAQNPTRLVSVELGMPLTFGNGYAESKSNSPELAHILENNKKRNGIFEFLNARLVFDERYFFVCNFDVVGYKFSRSKSIETLASVNSEYNVSRVSKYSYEGYDPTSLNSGSNNFKFGLGYQHPIRDSLYLETYAGYLRATYTPAYGLYAFKDPNSNLFYVHEYLMPKAPGRGWFAGIGIKRVAKEGDTNTSMSGAFFEVRIEMSQFEANGTGTDVVTDLYENKVELPLSYQVKTTALNCLLGVGLIF